MRYLSLFSGIEAASCAWSPLDWELKGVCEIEKFPCNVLKHHYPDVPNIGDITKLTREKLEALGPIDLIVGGSPCQGFSVAGKQGGLNDVRSRLAVDYIRVINTVKPRWIVWENVPGVFSTGKGMDFKLFTAALTHFGYGICWRILDAQWFGAAQRRRRVFLVGYFGDWRPAYKVLFESQSLPRYFETLERKREDLARKAEARTGKTGTGTTSLNPWSEQSKRVLDINGKCDCLCASEKMRSITKIFDDRTKSNNLTAWDNQSKQIFGLNGKSPALCSGEKRYGGLPVNVFDDRGTAACMGYGKYVETNKAETLRASGGDLGGGSENICYDMNHPCDVIRTYEDGKTPTLEARMGTGGNNIPLVTDDTHNYQPIVLESNQNHATITQNGKSPTLTASMGMGGGYVPMITESYRIGSYHSNAMKSGNPNSGIYKTEKANTLDASDPTPACQQGGIAVCIHARIRKLTPTECLRLQGFPDDWFNGVDGYSDTAAYKAIGNSMAVPCMRWIGERIDTVEKEL